MRRSRLVTLVVVCLLFPVPVAAAPGVPNDAPFADAGLDRTVRVGDTVLLDGGGSVDPDGRLVGYEWRVETPRGRSVAPTDPTDAATRLSPATPGRYTVTLTVEDDDGATRMDALFVDVRAVATPDRAAASNDPPTGYVQGPSQVAPGERAAFRAAVTDPDGRVVSHRWSTGATGRRVTEAFDPADGDEVTLSVTVTDDDGATARLERTVEVRAPDAAANATGRDLPPDAFVDGPDRVAVGEAATYTLRGSDPDGSIARYEWDRPESTTGRTLTHAFAEPGRYPVRGTVVDDAGASDAATRTVEVYAAGEPAARLSGPDAAPAGSVRTYSLEAFDPDGGPVTVSWSPASGSTESQFETAVRMPDDPNATLTVAATVTDDEGERVTVDRRVDVLPTDASEESVPEIGDATVWRVSDEHYQTDAADTMEAGTYAFVADVESDAAGPLTATWTLGDGTVKTETLAAADDGVPSSVRHTFVSDDVTNGSRAVADVRLTVTDAAGRTTTEPTNASVSPVLSHDDVGFDARAGDRTPVDGTLTVPAGTTVAFGTDVSQSFRVEFGDGTVREFERTATADRFAHTYDAVGTYTVQLLTVQGPKGYGVGRVTVRVAPSAENESRRLPTPE